MGKENILTEEQQKRKDTLRRRMFWLLVLFDVALIAYLIIQIGLIIE